MSNKIAEIVNTSMFSTGFPNKTWEELYNRGNFITIIDSTFKENNLIFLEGEEDAGKTTLCAQFCRLHSQNSISVFYSSLNQMDLNIEYFYTEIVSQARLLLGDKIEDIENDEISTLQDYTNVWHKIRRKYNGKKDVLYLVIDGMEDSLIKKRELVETILENITFDDSFLKVLITGSQKKYLEIFNKLKKTNYTPLSIVGFGEQDIISFLNIDKKDAIYINDLFKITKGFPGRLATCKRLLLTKKLEIKDISSSKLYSEWIELDCNNIDLEDKKFISILSLLSLSDEIYKLNHLESILNIDSKNLISIINTISILEIDNESVKFISNSHKKFISNKLKNFKNNVIELLENHYSNDNTISGIYEYSKLLFSNQKWQKVIDMIDESYIQNTIEKTGSLLRVKESIAIGSISADNISSYQNILKYSLQGSIISELDNYLFWESEILARIALNDFNGAILLADSAIITIERLKLLALIARKEKQVKNTVNEDLVKTINDLYKNIDLSNAGEIIYDIVADLIYAIPNLAIEIIEKSSSNKIDTNINDWIIAKLSIAAINSSSKSTNQEIVQKNNAIQKLNNPNVAKINKAISFLVGNYSAARVLEEVKKIAESTEKLKFLRLWLTNYRKNINNIDLVIEKAISELIVSSSHDTITFELLKEISSQLPFIKSSEKKHELFLRFTKLDKDIIDIGLSSDKFIYKLTIFHTMHTMDFNKSKTLLIALLKEAESINDLLMQIEAYCEIYTKLLLIADPLLSRQKGYTYHKINGISLTLLNSTANHFKLCSNFLKTLGKVNTYFCLEIIDKINNEFYRDNARILVLETYLTNNFKIIKIEQLANIYKSFESAIPKEIALQLILEKFSESKRIEDLQMKELFYFFKEIQSLPTSYEKITSLILTYKVLCKNHIWKCKLEKSIKSKILNEWDRADSDWEKINIGFIIAEKLSLYDLKFSKECFNKTEELKQSIWVESSAIAFTYINLISLLLKSFFSLLNTKSNTDADYNAIKRMIKTIPSRINRLKLWTELSINSYLYDDLTLSKKVFNEEIISTFQGLEQDNYNISNSLDTLIIFHIFNTNLTDEILLKLNDTQREEACSKICRFHISRRNPYESYDDEISKYNSNYGDIIKAISLLTHINSDNELYPLIDEIYKAIKGNKEHFSKMQVDEIAKKLKIIIGTKLPDLKNIKHDGYKIISLLKIELISKQNPNWNEFVDEARKIPNLSDRILVKANLLESLPFEKLDPKTKSELFEEVIIELRDLKSHFEFVERVSQISDKMFEINKNKWKEIVSDAFNASNEFKKGDEKFKAQKNIIDSIYRLEPSYAKELLKSFDSEARESKNAFLLKNHLKTLEMTSKIKNNEKIEDKEKLNKKIIIDSIHRSYKALNSGKILPKKVPEVIKYLSLCNNLPLHETIFVYRYYLTNCAKIKTSKNNSYAEVNRDNFTQILKLIDLVQILSKQKRNKNKSISKYFNSEELFTQKMINYTSKEGALEYIREWLEEEMKEYVVIVDPYFSPEDIEILKIIKEINHKAIVTILSCSCDKSNTKELEYKAYWKKISDELPPYTRIINCWIEEDTSFKLIHDRWIFTDNCGICLGTSLKSLGNNKESTINHLDTTKSKEDYSLYVKDYVEELKTELNNQRIYYKKFTL